MGRIIQFPVERTVRQQQARALARTQWPAPYGLVAAWMAVLESCAGMWCGPGSNAVTRPQSADEAKLKVR